MIEYEVYLDVSGSPDDQPYVLIAGFLATKDQWLSFEPEWKRLLKRYNLGEVFHMTDFEAGRRKNRGIILDALTDVINAHTKAHFSCSVKMESYRKVNEIYPLEEAIGTPYSIVARGIARNINLWKLKYFREGDRVLIFVEEGTKHHGDMEEAFRRDDLPIPQKVPKGHPSVQPADMLDWEAHHYVRYEDNRKSLLKLVTNGEAMPEAHGKFDEANMIFSCKQMHVPLRRNLDPNIQIVYRTSPKRPRRRTIK
jgi:hypothetical protein